MNPFVIGYLLTRKKNNYSEISEEENEDLKRCSKYVFIFGVILVIILIIFV
jgi:hypothetical protein